MSERPDTAWNRFLEADLAGRDGEAEAALAELFRQLPERRPTPGFSRRVMAGLDRRRAPFRRPLVRLALAATLVATAVSGGLLLPALGPLLERVGPGGFVALAISAFVGLVHAFTAGLAVWEPIGVTFVALGRALGDPGFAALMVSQLLLAGLALRGLVSLSRWKRSPLHAST